MTTVVRKRAMPQNPYRRQTTARRRLTYNQPARQVARYAYPPTSELKFHDVTVSDPGISGSGDILVSGSVCQIPQSVGESGRVGRKCTVTAINYRYTVTLLSQSAASIGTTNDEVRVILYWDKQANGAAATTTDILETAHWQSFNNLANKNRFQILKDSVHSMSVGSANTTATAPLQKVGAMYLKCNIPLEFSGATGAITELRSNNLGVLTICRSTGKSEIDGKMRIRYHD